MDINVAIGIATGVILFLYGIDSFSREIKTIAGEDLRRILSSWTKNRFYGMTLGALVTAMIQSSTATSVLTVSLVNSAVIHFRQSISIILGTNIGTTVTAFLVAYKLTNIGPWFIITGFALSIIRVKYSFVGKALFYFGLVFFALSQLSAVTTPLKGDPEFTALFAHLSNPLYGLALGTIMTLVIQSSSVTTGLVVILVQSGAIDLAQAIPIILGTNIGTTFTGIIASLSMDTYARRAATVNTLFNLGGSLLFLPFIYPFTDLIHWIGGTPGQMTATAHLLFNVTSSLIFVFFIRQLEWLATKIIKGDDHEIVFATQHIKQTPEGDFAANLKLLELEIAHYLEISRNMLSTVISYIDLKTKEGFDRIEKYIAYSAFMAKSCEKALHDLSQNNKNQKTMTKLVRMLRMVDYIRQSAVSQRQIADIPELLRLPNVEELTQLKAEIFGMSNMLSQIYEHLAKYLRSHDRSELHKVDVLNSSLTKKINETYSHLVFDGGSSSERLKSFFLSFLTRLQSVKAKLREIRKLAVLYADRPATGKSKPADG